MIDYLFAGATVLTSIHAYSYGVWLKRNNNKRAYYGVMLLILSGLGLSGYRLFAQ